MKKISVFLALIILTVSTVYAGEYKTDIDFTEQPDSFCEEINDEGHIVKYDAKNADIYALNADGQDGQNGVTELSESVPEGSGELSDDNKEPEKELVNISYPEDEDKNYSVVYSNDFSKTDSIVQKTTDEEHYARLDEENKIATIKNTDGKGSCSLVLNLPNEYDKDGTRVAFTFYANAGHARMKSLYYNSSGEQIHQNNILLSGEEVRICDNNSSQVNFSLNKYKCLTPGRVELEFDFTNRAVTYRTATVSDGKWVFGKWYTGKKVYSASDSVKMSLSKIAFSNEYGMCDMYVDDVRVSVPKAKPVAKKVIITGMKTDYPITKDVLSGEFEYYDENGIAKGDCELSWVVSDDEKFENEIIKSTESTLLLDESYEGKYIKFRVIPVSEAGTRSDIAYESEAIGPVVLVEDLNTPPEAQEVEISGKIQGGAVVSAKYNYYDADFDDEGDTIVEWYIVKENTEIPVKTGSVSDLDFEIKEEYRRGKLKLVITPKSKNENEAEGAKVIVVSEEIPASAAYMDYMALTLSPESGSDIDESLYLPVKGENGSVISWESSQPGTLATDGSIKRGTRNEEVTLTATIASEGVEYKKEFIYTVLKKKTSSGGSTGGGGGSSFSGGSYAVAAPTENKLQEEKAPTTPEFGDLDGFDWAKKEINELYNKGIVSGDGSGNFYPGRNITRAEFVKMVVDFFEISGSADITFSDVSKENWYYESVKKAVAAGVVSGKSASLFGALENISREDMAVIICRIKGFKRENTQDAFFDDARISAYAKDAVYAMKEKGIINGRDTGEFDPKGSATRAEAARIICASGN